MAITNFIPEVFSARVLTTLGTSLVYGASDVVNRDYEGDISAYGDTVKITSFADPTIDDYAAHTDITFEDVDDATRSLIIDQAKFFAFEVDDIEKRQAVGDVMTTMAQRAAYKLRDVADQFVAGEMADDADAGNKLGAVSLADAVDAYDLLVDLGVVLDEDDVPSEGRFAIVTPAFHGLLIKDDRFIASGDAIAATVRANGRVGEAAGFSIRKSNNAPSGDTIIAGHNIATSYAEQIASVEATRLERRFADGLKGLHLYGAKVTRPTCLATAEITISGS